jgi:hypothetical protein
MNRLSVEAVDVNCADRQEVFETVMTAAMEQAAMTAEATINMLLDAEATEALGREHRAPRSASGDKKLPWACHRCGSILACDFERNGHYERGVQTTIRQLDNVQVPMLRCTKCGAAADAEFSVLRKHKQLWLDVDAEAIFCYGQAGGTRRIAEQVGQQLGWPIGHSSVVRRVREVVNHLHDWQHQPVEEPPDVLMVDGIWFSVQQPTGSATPIRRGAVDRLPSECSGWRLWRWGCGRRMIGCRFWISISPTARARTSASSCSIGSICAG